MLSLQGTQSWCPRPWSPNLSARCAVRRVDGPLFLSVTETLENRAPIVAGLPFFLLSRDGNAPHCWKGLVRRRLVLHPLLPPPTSCALPLPAPPPPAPTHTGELASAPVHFHKSFPQENEILLHLTPKIQVGQGGKGTPNLTGADVESPIFPPPLPLPKAQLLSRLFLFL